MSNFIISYNFQNLYIQFSKLHLLCFVLKTFSRLLYVSSGEKDIDRKMEKTSAKSSLLKLNGS